MTMTVPPPPDPDPLTSLTSPIPPTSPIPATWPSTSPIPSTATDAGEGGRRVDPTNVANVEVNGFAPGRERPGAHQAGERPAGGRGSVERGSRTGASGGWLYGRFMREVGYTLVCFPLAIVGFVYVVVALSTGPALAVTFLGIPLLATMLVGARGFGTVQRALAAEMLGDRVAPPRPLRPRRRGAKSWVWAGLRDGAGWRACVYLLVKFPLAITNFVVTVAFCSAGLGGVTYPVWQRYLPVQHDSAGRPHRGASFGTDYFLDTWPRMAMAVAAGAVLLYLARPLIHGLVGLDRLLIRGLLGPTNRQLAAERMHELEFTRASAVDDSAAALRRIERDLHDGAQARLVSMAMNLGAVREQLATADGDSLDLDRTRSRSTPPTATSRRPSSSCVTSPAVSTRRSSTMVSRRRWKASPPEAPAPAPAAVLAGSRWRCMSTCPSGRRRRSRRSPTSAPRSCSPTPSGTAGPTRSESVSSDAPDGSGSPSSTTGRAVPPSNPAAA
ncbi:sensor domain-containing protein [Candidatus Frankia nodulisporulans]|uniref:sensor domain-containing protein n=1 Tax=Candidatus Frankia nodulisporulans TaxID=2060052 RepID=UPI001CDCEF18|nr:sensor domain-containing protein [Candidatus Frankia nodulisporulans]